ncbi:hypothetical protein WMY93_020510 [Mugilogobius chulae]|uniref:Uncharacterized protein n=1 Tax=Mugilogobius chulae TaxID=88201 RepID=A0AAW0N9P5_9GOBI
MTLQMGIKHFSGLFVMLCVGVALSLLTTIAEHIVFKLVIPRVKEPRLKYWLHTSQRLHRALNSVFTDDKLPTVTKPEKRCNEGTTSRPAGTPQKRLTEQTQSSPGGAERPGAALSSGPSRPVRLTLTPSRSWRTPAVVTTANGRSDLLGRLTAGPGGTCPGLTPVHWPRDGECAGVGRNTLVQELSELESQIHLIKQQLQSAMRRKRELEQYQAEPDSLQPAGPQQANQFSPFTQCHQQTNQHTNTLPDF